MPRTHYRDYYTLAAICLLWSYFIVLQMTNKGFVFYLPAENVKNPQIILNITCSATLSRDLYLPNNYSLS